MGCIVSKFGGWANASSENVKMAADLFISNPDRKIKVNSAVGKVEGLPKVTDLLIDGAEKTIKKGSFPEDIFDYIKLNHYHVFKPLGVPVEVIDGVMEILSGYIAKKDILSDDHFRALLVGSGEELFSRLDAYYLKEIRGVNAKYVDPRDVGHHLTGHPLNGRIMPDSYDNLAKLKDMSGVIVYPGFFGVSEDGKPMIYSRGGTDKTAADVAKAVNASMYENWKDVDGIFCADPRIVKDPMLMSEVTYKEIRELSYISFNVLHQEAMLPVMHAKIPINIKHLHKPDTKGTVIVNERSINYELPVIGIAHLKNICTINLEKTLMNEELGFADKILSLFRENRINVEQITTGIDTIGLMIRHSEFKEKSVHFGISESIRKEIDIDAFGEYLQNSLNLDKVQINRGRSIICIVGEGMKNHVGILHRVAKVCKDAGINIELIDQGPSERNIIIGIKDAEDHSVSRKCVELLYKELFPS